MPAYLPPGAYAPPPPSYGAPTYAALPYTVPPYGATPYAAPPRQAPPVRTAQNNPVHPTAVRGQAPESPPVRPPTTAVVLPSPDQLGVAGSVPADGGLDWSASRRRLQDLGAVTFQLDKLPSNVWQFTCLVPTAEPNRTHRIEAHGATEGEAVRRALDEAERWHKQGR